MWKNYDMNFHLIFWASVAPRPILLFAYSSLLYKTMKEEERQADSENFQVLPGLPHTHRAARIDRIRHFGPRKATQLQNSNGKNWLKSIICELIRYARAWPGTQNRRWKSLSSGKIHLWRWKCRLIRTIFIWVNRTGQSDVDKIWLTDKKNIKFTR